MLNAVDSANPSARRGSVLVLAAALMIVIFALTAFTVDVGYISLTTAELQNAADAAALAAAQELLAERVINPHSETAEDLARTEASRLAAANRAGCVSLVLNDQKDVSFGEWTADRTFAESSLSSRHNAVRVTLMRSDSQNGSLPLFFAPILGHEDAELQATAIAAFPGNISGFRPTPQTGSTSLIPLTVQADHWISFISGLHNDGDSYACDPSTGEVTTRSDGVKELILFSRDLAYTGGNFGTLNIGSADSGTPDLLREIREGLSSTDLDYHGNELSLDPVTRTLDLSGDTGIETPVIHAARDILGKPVTLPMFSTVTGNGHRTIYTITGFVGVRIVHADASGRDRRIVVQPAYIVDDSAISGGGQSWFVYGRPRIVQ